MRILEPLARQILDDPPLEMSLKAYLRLVRLPNLFTAAADSLAGWLLAGGSLAEPTRYGPIMLASIAIYAGGIALNDVCDVELDRVERPERPLPSGTIGVTSARRLALLLLASGPLLAWLGGGMPSFCVGIALAFAVLLYDLALRRTLGRATSMGTCRALNFLMGMAFAWPSLGQPHVIALVAYGLFVAGLTWISRAETETGRTRPIVLGLTVQNLALLGLATVALWTRTEPTDQPRIPAGGLLVLALVALAVNFVGGRAVQEPRPQTIMKAVKTGVLSLVWIHVALVAAWRGPAPALAVAALGPPAVWLARRISPT